MSDRPLLKDSDSDPFLKKLRKHLDRNQGLENSLAQRIGRSDSTVHQWLFGEEDIPFLDLRRICDVLELEGAERRELLRLGGFDLPEMLKLFCYAKGISQAKIASKLKPEPRPTSKRSWGVDPSTVNKWFASGSISLARLEEIFEICELPPDEREEMLNQGGFRYEVKQTLQVVAVDGLLDHMRYLLSEQITELLPKELHAAQLQSIPELVQAIVAGLQKYGVNLEEAPTTATSVTPAQVINTDLVLSPSIVPIVQALSGQSLALGNAEIGFVREGLHDFITFRDLSRGFEWHMTLDPTTVSETHQEIAVDHSTVKGGKFIARSTKTAAKTDVRTTQKVSITNQSHVEDTIFIGQEEEPAERA